MTVRSRLRLRKVLAHAHRCGYVLNASIGGARGGVSSQYPGIAEGNAGVSDLLLATDLTTPTGIMGNTMGGVVRSGLTCESP